MAAVSQGSLGLNWRQKMFMRSVRLGQTFTYAMSARHAGRQTCCPPRGPHLEAGSPSTPTASSPVAADSSVVAVSTPTTQRMSEAGRWEAEVV